MIFVLGSGRSGTHWLGHILESHSELHVTIEDPRFFADATAMAVDPRLRAELLPKLVQAYHAESARVDPLQFADKSHPNIWQADQLAAELPNARFVGIQRDPWGTTASMLQHAGVLGWHRRWREFPVPNRFLGISPQNAPGYDEESEATRCALRWRSHHEQMTSLKQRLGERLLVLDYTALILNPEPQLQQLQKHIGVSTAFPIPEVKVESLSKWRSELTADQVQDVAAIVGFMPPNQDIPSSP